MLDLSFKPFLIFLALLTASLNTFAQNQWVLNTNKEGIKVYTREVKDSKFKEYRGEVMVNCKLSTLVALLDDVDNQKNWFHDCIESKKLKNISKTEGINYFQQYAPWPVSNRDIVVKYKISQNNDTKVITIELTGLKSYIPEKNDIVRVPKLTGFWQFIPQGNGTVKVIYQAHSETGGMVPASLANAACVDIPFNTLKNLLKEIQKSKYKNAVIEGVLEP